MASRSTVVMLFVYGFVLAVFAGFGTGDGVFGLLGLAGSPFSLIGYRSSFGYEPAFAAAALQWGLLGVVMRFLRPSVAWVGLFLAVHSVGAIFLLSHSASPYADWAYLRGLPRLWPAVALGMAWYLAGQALLWRMILMARGRDADDARATAQTSRSRYRQE